MGQILFTLVGGVLIITLINDCHSYENKVDSLIKPVPLITCTMLHQFNNQGTNITLIQVTSNASIKKRKTNPKEKH